MLVAAPDHRRTGVGRLSSASRSSSAASAALDPARTALPREWRHPSKEFLKSWYGRIGYRLVRTPTIAEGYPHLAPLLATPCDFEVYEKSLQAQPDVDRALRGSRRGRSHPARGR